MISCVSLDCSSCSECVLFVSKAAVVTLSDEEHRKLRSGLSRTYSLTENDLHGVMVVEVCCHVDRNRADGQGQTQRQTDRR